MTNGFDIGYHGRIMTCGHSIYHLLLSIHR